MQNVVEQLFPDPFLKNQSFLFLFFYNNDLHNTQKLNKQKKKIHRTVPQTNIVLPGGEIKIKIYY